MAPIVLLPHFMLVVPLVVAVVDGTLKWAACRITIVNVLALVTIYWSRGLYRFEKENKWLSGIWGFANKYVKNNSGAKKWLKKLIDDFSTPPPIIPEAIKKRFRRS